MAIGTGTTTCAAAFGLLLAGLAPANSAEEPTAPAKYQVMVDVDRDGHADTVTLSAPRGGDGTRVRVDGSAGKSAQVRLPFRGKTVDLSDRLAGAAAVTGPRNADLVVLTESGACNAYRILRWSRGRLGLVRHPGGGKEWRVCALGVAPKGSGFRSALRRNRVKMIVYIGRPAGDRVVLIRKASLWTGKGWRRLGAERTTVRAASTLRLWGLSFHWTAA